MSNFKWEIEKNVHQRIDTAKHTLPYQFLKIESKKSEKTPRIKLNENMGKTGSLQCSLQVLNGLIIGNEHNEKTQTIQPLVVNRNGQDEYYISSYTLKGCLRQFIASITNTPLRQVENEAYFFRPSQFFEPRGRENNDFAIAAGIISKVEKDGSFEATKIKPPFCFTRKDNEDRRGNKIVKLNRDWNYRTRISRQKIEVWFQDRNGDKLHFVPYRDGIDGQANFSKLFGKPKSHDAFGYLTKNKTSDNVTSSASIVAQYNAIPELIIKYHMANHPNIKDDNLNRNRIEKSDLENNIRKDWQLKEGDLILYEYDTNTNEILSFGKHFRYLWTYKNRIWDFDEVCIVDVENFKKDFLFVTDEMFGYSFSSDEKKYLKQNDKFDLNDKKDGKPLYNSTKSGKVHFNFAKYVDSSGVIDKTFTVPGTDSPHASSYEFYLHQDNNKEKDDILNNYGDRFEDNVDSHLSGRKIYRRSTNYLKNIEKQKSNGHIGDINTTLFKSEKEEIAEFKFAINFENLSDYEFRILLFALTFGSNQKYEDTKQAINQYCHQIGYAKNFGLGAVNITVDKILIAEFKDNNISLNQKSFNEFSLSNFWKLKTNNGFDSLKLTDKVTFYPHDYSYKGNEQHRVDRETGHDIDTIFAWHAKVRQQDHENRKVNYKTRKKNDSVKDKFESKAEYDREINDLQDSF